MNHTIDAKGKKLGRIATEAAVLLMGKNLPTFKRNAVTEVKVSITNASKISASEKKMLEKDYARYSGYPGGLTKETMAHLSERKGYSEVVRKAVFGMLPKNKLQRQIIKNLTITE